MFNYRIGLATIVVSLDLAMRMSRKTSGNEATGKSRMSWIGNRTIVSYRILGVATYQESQGIQEESMSPLRKLVQFWCLVSEGFLL